jgi:hypothetical protein
MPVTQQGGKQLFNIDRFGKALVPACGQGAGNLIVLGDRRQHDDEELRRSLFLPDESSGPDAAHYRHLQVHENPVEGLKYKGGLKVLCEQIVCSVLAGGSCTHAKSLPIILNLSSHR